MLAGLLTMSVGLDPSRYRNTTVTDTEARQFSSLDTLMSDAEKYKDAAPFIVRCRGCQGEVMFSPVTDRQVRLYCMRAPRALTLSLKLSLLLPSGPTCPGCHTHMGTASLAVQLELQIREQISKYYKGWTVCDDQTCGNRTRMMGVYGRRCLKHDCLGTVTFEASYLN